MRRIASVTMQNANTAPVSEKVEQEIEQPALIQPMRTGALSAGGRLKLAVQTLRLLPFYISFQGMNWLPRACMVG